MLFKTGVSVAFAYSLIVSGGYLFAYWGPFEVNILEQIGFADLAKIALYPVAAVAIFLLVGSVITQLFAGRLLEPGKGSVRNDGSVRTWQLWYSGILLLASFFAYRLLPEPGCWLVVGTLAGLAAFPLSENAWLSKAIPNAGIRALVPLFSIMILAQAVYTGRSDAYRVLSGDPQRVVDPVRSGLPLMSSSDAPLAYLGLLGETHFLYESVTGQVVSIKDRDGFRLFFSHESSPSKMVRKAKRALFRRSQRAEGMRPSPQPLIMEVPARNAADSKTPANTPKN